MYTASDDICRGGAAAQLAPLSSKLVYLGQNAPVAPNLIISAVLCRSARMEPRDTTNTTAIMPHARKLVWETSRFQFYEGIYGFNFMKAMSV